MHYHITYDECDNSVAHTRPTVIFVRNSEFWICMKLLQYRIHLLGYIWGKGFMRAHPLPWGVPGSSGSKLTFHSTRQLLSKTSFPPAKETFSPLYQLIIDSGMRISENSAHISSCAAFWSIVSNRI